MLNEDPDNTLSDAGATGAARVDDVAPSHRSDGTPEGYVTVTQQDREAISRVSKFI